MKVPLQFVRPKYLYKKCVRCDEVQHIDEYSQTIIRNNIMYTQAKCKKCRREIRVDNYAKAKADTEENKK